MSQFDLGGGKKIDSLVKFCSPEVVDLGRLSIMKRILKDGGGPHNEELLYGVLPV